MSAHLTGERKRRLELAAHRAWELRFVDVKRRAGLSISPFWGLDFGVRPVVTTQPTFEDLEHAREHVLRQSTTPEWLLRDAAKATDWVLNEFFEKASWEDR